EGGGGLGGAGDEQGDQGEKASHRLYLLVRFARDD
ncbi:MAG: hypothetical protein ACI8RZ_006155, partial [Myxococcota bacterium]